MDFATALNMLIENEIATNIASAKATEIVSTDEFIASETIGEVMEKLLILNIRIWHLVDQVASAPDKQVPIIQRKLWHLFRTERPRLVVALNKMLAALVSQLDLVEDENVKSYRGKDE